MKLQVLQENLSKALVDASRFASIKAQLPVLGNIALSAKKTKLLISSTNLEISIATSIGAKVEEDGDITIPAKTITEAISNLPSGPVALESEKEQLKIKSQNFSLNTLGMNSSDFPSIPTSLDEKDSLVFSKEEFLSALSSVIFATSQDETRPVLTGVLFIFDKDSLVLVATDGFRLSQRKIKLDEQKGKLDIDRLILPKSVLSEITRLSKEEILFSYKKSDNQVLFGIGDSVVSSRVLEGSFPDFDKIIPKSSNTKILLDKEELLRAVKLASIFARDSANVVKLEVKKGVLSLSSESHTSGSQKGGVDAKVEGEDIEIAFNYRFLEDYLNSVKGDEVKIEFSGSNAPGVFTDTEDSDYLHLIMPVRIQG